VEDKELSR